jgi:hypothetical protein
MQTIARAPILVEACFSTSSNTKSRTGNRTSDAIRSKRAHVVIARQSLAT